MHIRKFDVLFLQGCLLESTERKGYGNRSNQNVLWMDINTAEFSLNIRVPCKADHWYGEDTSRKKYLTA